jgi:hypothetical protein
MGGMRRENLLGETPATYLPDNEEASSALRSGADPAGVAARFPSCCAAWAELAERAMEGGDQVADHVAAYAYARAGYHRGLDQLRRAGWRGHGPVPWEHEPNRGFLRALYMLASAAAAIGEQDEAERCREFLADSSQTAVTVLQQA